MKEEKLKAFFENQVHAVVERAAVDQGSFLPYFAEHDPRDDEILALLAVSTGGLISVESRLLQRGGQNWVRCMVLDNGPGISADVLPNLFEAFVSTRLDARCREGAGLSARAELRRPRDEVKQGAGREERCREDGRPPSGQRTPATSLSGRDRPAVV